MAREYTPLPFEFLEEMDLLSDEEYGRLIRAMQIYSITGEDKPPTGQERFFWKRARNVVDRYTDSYESRHQASRENGRKGGRPRKPDGFSENLENLENLEKPVGFFENLEKPSESQKTQTKTETKTKTKTETKAKENTPQKPPTGGDAFEAFWAVYPRKVGKLAAKKAFERVNMPLETLLTALRRQKCSAQWTAENGRYIPNPATWLNQGRWEDEVRTEQPERREFQTSNPFLELLEEARERDGAGDAGHHVGAESGLPRLLPGDEKD